MIELIKAKNLLSSIIWFLISAHLLIGILEELFCLNITQEETLASSFMAPMPLIAILTTHQERLKDMCTQT